VQNERNSIARARGVPDADSMGGAVGVETNPKSQRVKSEGRGVVDANWLHIQASVTVEIGGRNWQVSDHQEQSVRRSIYKALIDAGIEAVVEIASKLMKLLRRAGP